MAIKNLCNVITDTIIFPQECEAEFTTCVENGDVSTAMKRSQTFAACMEPELFSGFSGCSADCAPTFKMMSSSEYPSVAEFSNWGAGPDRAVQRPKTSICEIQ